MVRFRLASFVLILTIFGNCAGAIELTPENWADHAAEKTLFLKFYAPWCGHCKKIKPDWARLTQDFANSPTALVAEVDCTGAAKSLCEQHGVSGYPTLKWGKANNLEVYEGPRTYEDMKKFALSKLGKSCAPDALELCDKSHREALERFMRVSPEALDEKLETAEKQLKSAELWFARMERNLTLEIQMAARSRDAKVKAIKEKKGLPQGASHAQGAFDLTLENWDAKVAGKTVFIKFFAPWCGHCKAMENDWNRLMTDFEGTKTALIAQADCVGKGKDLCDKHDVTGYPRLLWGNPENLVKYNGGRTYEELKSFADSHLGKSCGPSNLNLCDEEHAKNMEELAKLSPEKLQAKERSAEKAVKKVMQWYEDTQWNLTGQIDLAEQQKDKRVKAIKDQGLDAAKEVQAWNRKQPPGFWKPPPGSQPPPPSSFWSLLQETAFEASGYQFTILDACLIVCVITTAGLVLTGLCKRSQPSCTARHIVVKEEKDILKIKERLENGEEFGKLAEECSFCSSKDVGGSLGTRTADHMDPAMAQVCFNPTTKLGKVMGPIKTKHGYHLVIVDTRQGLPKQTTADSSSVPSTETDKNK